MTVRLAQDVGMPLIGEYAKRFGVYDDLPNYLSYALGAGETTVLRMTTAYSMFANGGRRIKPTLIRSEEHTSELQSLRHLVCRLLLEKKKKKKKNKEQHKNRQKYIIK